MKRVMNKFQKKFNQLKSAIKIGNVVIMNATKVEQKEKDDYLRGWNEQLKQLDFLDEKFKNLRSLAYLEDDFLIYWNESMGNHVEEFWKLLSSNNIEYERKNVLLDTLKRGRIKNIHEYHTIQDGLVIAFQEERITQDELEQLGSILSKYEEKNRGKL
jgi:hypothetical protein